ncbi:MAG: hypothetical protein ACK54H_09810 [Phycisphaerales bacterium]
MFKPVVASIVPLLSVPALFAQDVAPAPSAHPAVKLGDRVRVIDAKRKPLAHVVIVTDADSYIDAIGAWSSSTYFPVLIDLGDRASREDIARFVRAYKPESILRWDTKRESRKGVPGEAGFATCDEKSARRALADSLDLTTAPEDAKALVDAVKETVGVPAGVVFANVSDPAWTAALALAAGRAQPLMFLPAAKNFGGAYNTEGAEAFAGSVREAVSSLGLSWDSSGDDIDAVTLGMNVPVKYDPGSSKERYALTDRIGRHDDPARRDRWAWCGQIPGNASQAAYRAMCSLFLQPTSAWIFDGYPPEGDWNRYDGTAAGASFSQAGLSVETLDAPKNDSGSWRARCAMPFNHGLAMVTTKGNSDFFDLSPGQCKPGDIPIISRPLAVHFVHSWSLQQPDDINTVGGRWLSRGVYAYFGSVDEPFLGAFVPTPALADRIIAGAPFVAACRLDESPRWKTASLADPLWCVGPVRSPSSDAPALPEARVIGADLRAKLQDGRFGDAIVEMHLQGKDKEIATLLRALVARTPDAVSSQIGAIGVLAAFRIGDDSLLATLFQRCDAETRKDTEILDALWLSSHAAIANGDARRIALLRTHLRPSQIEKDRALLVGGK